jgi:hypothetical protein
MVNIDKYKLVLVYQRGNEEVYNLISEKREIFDSVIETNPSGKTIDSFITNNRIIGYYMGFEYWKSDFVVSVEDDVLMAPDALEFIEHAYTRYKNDNFFRGVNLGSHLPFDEETSTSFSLLRYGIHGPASMITKGTWDRIKPKRVLENHHIIFDAQIEFELKTGFMVTPHASRYLDNGINGSHTGEEPKNDYFTLLEGSFVGGRKVNKSYFLKNKEPHWRSDCIIYRPRSNLKFFIKAKLYWLLLAFPNLQKKMGRDD